MKIQINIAVRSLVEYVLRSGDLVIDFTGTRRAIDAIRAHQKVQRSRPSDYLSEVTVDYQHESEDFTLNIGGRIDGIYPAAPNRTVCIDEIKTTVRDLDKVVDQNNPLHWGQAKTYAFMYAEAHDLPEVDIQLTYFHLETGEMRTQRISNDRRQLQAFFQDLVSRYLKWARTVIAWRQKRDNSIRALPFPFEDYRPGQRQMAVDIYRVIRERQQMILQAPTGIGKTMGALFPAIKSITEGLCNKIFYLTARTTGRSVAEKALDDLKKVGLRFKSLTLTAKDKICFCPSAACNPDECEFTRGYYDRLNDAILDVFQKDSFTRTVVEDAARNWTLCPFEFSLELSLWADCVICDYNYAFDPRVYLRRFFLESADDYTFLIDEAHNLVDRSRDMFSAAIFKQPFLDVRRQTGKKLSRIYKCMGRVNSWLVKTRKRCLEAEGIIIEKDSPEGLYPLLRDFLHSTERWLRLNRRTSFRDSLLELYFSASAFMRVAEEYDDTYATFYTCQDRELKVRLFCIDPARQLGEALTRCRAAIFFSATMTPVDYFKDMFGCREDAHHLILPSPFPIDNFGQFMTHTVSTLFQDRESTAPQVSGAIAAFVGQRKGNYLLFFPSYAYLDKICSLFVRDHPGIQTIRQYQTMTEAERNAFIMQFSRSNADTLVGFAVMGGVFGEGIDLVGERLSGAVIVGVGLPGISPERELIREYFSEVYQAGFEYAYMFPGINRVLQAAGRVIRTEKDCGIVLLIDRRFGTRRYRSLLPMEWNPVRVADDMRLKDQVAEFWQRRSEDGAIETKL